MTSVLPSVFFSHGGPSFLFKQEGNPLAHEFLKSWGKTIKTEWKPKYVIVVSAHWSSPDKNEVNIAVPKSGTENELIYDFGGFPAHYYKEEFKTSNSLPIATQVRDLLRKGGFKSNLVGRGIDHGVWVPFKVAFQELDVPVLQVSLAGYGDDFESQYRVGKVLNQFRKDGALVVASGMSVHNLPKLRSGTSNGVEPFAIEFNQNLRDIFGETTDGADLLRKLEALSRERIFQDAHPTPEHFAPFGVSAGLLSEGSKVKEVFNVEQASLGWGFYEVN